jgi:hypothetical protein
LFGFFVVLLLASALFDYTLSEIQAIGLAVGLSVTFTLGVVELIAYLILPQKADPALPHSGPQKAIEDGPDQKEKGSQKEL